MVPGCVRDILPGICISSGFCSRNLARLLGEPSNNSNMNMFSGRQEENTFGDRPGKTLCPRLARRRISRVPKVIGELPSVFPGQSGERLNAKRPLEPAQLARKKAFPATGQKRKRYASGRLERRSPDSKECSRNCQVFFWPDRETYSCGAYPASNPIRL